MRQGRGYPRRPNAADRAGTQILDADHSPNAGGLHEAPNPCGLRRPRHPDRRPAFAADAITAKLSAPVAEKTKFIAGGAMFNCEADTCVALAPTSQTFATSTCKTIADKVGVVAVVRRPQGARRRQARRLQRQGRRQGDRRDDLAKQ